MTRPTPRPTRAGASRARRGATAALVAVALVGAAGCAGDDDSSGSVASSATEADSAATEAAAAPVTQQPADTDAGTLRTVTVTGEGSVTVRPDTAQVQIGVQVDGQSAQAVLDDASERADALISELESQGIAAEDITTTNLAVYPSYDPEGTKVTGYQASNSVSVTTRDLDRAGEVIDAAAGAAGGALTIDGISFSVADPQAALGDARTRAVEQAAQRAEELAAAAGLQVGDVVSMAEGSSSTPGFQVAADVAEAAAVPIEPGSQQLTTQVTVVYELVGG